MSSSRVDQRGATSGRDLVAGNKEEHHHHYSPDRASLVASLMERLAREIEQDVQVQTRIEALQFYYERHSVDGIDGLEAKLRHAGRADEVKLAARKQEMFYRLLVEFSHFPSAQQIFAYLLSKIEQAFSSHLHPAAAGLSRQQFDVLLEEKVTIPIIDEVGAGVFCLNAALVSGMVYWLGEQCYVRWHS